LPLRVNGHGLALWVTTPVYLYCLYPRRTAAPHLALVLTVLCVALPTLFYQNSGWLQFGYRFSNDYALFLFALLAVGGRRFGAAFLFLAAFAVAINAFGALTFGRAEGSRFYYVEPTQRVLYEPD
jgi:CDP-diglyceride synthetase